jgi:single-stranded DNA-specific DHH superfamily exonuclease
VKRSKKTFKNKIIIKITDRFAKSQHLEKFGTHDFYAGFHMLLLASQNHHPQFEEACVAVEMVAKLQERPWVK